MSYEISIRTLRICGIDVQFIHASPKKLAGAGSSVGLILQALRYFGARMIPDDTLKKLSKGLTNKDVKALNSVKHKTLLNLVPHIDRILKYASVH